MEEKERYKLESYNEAFCQIHDTESDEWYLRKDLVKDLLNQQDKHIKELENKLEHYCQDKWYIDLDRLVNNNEEFKQFQNKKAIEVLLRLRKKFEPYHLGSKQSYLAGEVMREIDIQISEIKELGGGNV